MIIVAGGCSFIHGDELKDWDKVSGSQSTWPALLSSGHQYELVAGGGWSNQSIARNVINKVSQVGDCGVVVQWTFPARYEFRFAYDTGQRSGHWYNIMPWNAEDDDFDPSEFFFDVDDDQTIIQKTHHENANQKGMNSFAKSYFRNIGTEMYWENYVTLKEILYLQMYLKQMSVPYMFTAADNCIMHNHIIENPDDTIAAIYYSIDWSKFFWFPKGKHEGETVAPRGFYQWAVENKYPMYTTHPKEQAHQDAAELIRETFHAMVTQHN